ncbi:MAG: hypothetical protein JEZ12_21770 [Desulfobacterium sp.]|nr:hypothetical protein [Desulfobacterium sp.]
MRLSILVVDDDKDFLKDIIRNFEKKFTKINILGASSGEAALDIFSKDYLATFFELTRENFSETSRISGPPKVNA